MNSDLTTDFETLLYPIHHMLGVPEKMELQVETIPGPTTAVTLKVSLTKDPQKHYFVKTITKDTLPGSHLNLGLREVRFYSFINSLGLDPCPYIPTCVNSFIVEGEKGYFLVLEDLSDSHKAYDAVDFSNFANLRAPVRALAKFHQAYTGKLSAEQIRHHSDNLQAVEKYIQKLENAFSRFKKDFQGLVDGSVLSLMERAFPLISAFEVEKLERTTQNRLTTILHRDAHLKNFLYPRTAGEEAMIVDWQFWGLGIGVFDLRHLLGSVFQNDQREQQEDLVRYYYDVYQDGLDLEYSWENCWDDYRKGIIDNLFMPVWQYAGFGWTYEQWGKTLAAAVANYDVLNCEELR